MRTDTLAKLVAAVLAALAFIGVRLGWEAHRKESELAQVVRKIDEGQLLSDAELEILAKNPRKLWRSSVDRGVLLRAFQRSSLAQLQRELPALEPLPPEEESLPFAEHAWWEF